MKIVRALGIAFALLAPLAAFATPDMKPSCHGWCPACPYCPMTQR